MPILSAIKRELKKSYGRLTGKNTLNHRGKGIINFIDVGAMGSLIYPWEFNANRIQWLLKFEPRDEARETDHMISRDAVLWKDNAEREFFTYAGDGGCGSSLFRQNYDYVNKNFATLQKIGNPVLAETWFERSKLVREQRVKCRRLDDVIAELKPAIDFDFLKIDAQGAEFEILQGAGELLERSCVGLHLELFTIPLYTGITLLPEVEAYLAPFGFKMIKKFPPHGSFNSQHDCVFMKTGVNSSKTHLIKTIYGL